MFVVELPYGVVSASLSKALFGGCILVLLWYFFADSSTELALKDAFEKLWPDLRDSGDGTYNRPEFSKHLALKISDTGA